MAALLRVSAACLLDLIDTVRRGVGARPLGVDSGRSNLGRRPARVLRDRRRAGRCGPGLLDGRDSFADDKPFDDAFAELAELAVTHTEAAIRLGIVNGDPGWFPGYADTDEATGPSGTPLQIRLLGPVLERFRDEDGDVRLGLRRLATDSKTRNGHSIVLRFDYGRARILMTGDLNDKSQRLLLSYVPESELAADVAKGCHHGSEDIHLGFIRALGARATVISSGDGRPAETAPARVLVVRDRRRRARGRADRDVRVLQQGADPRRRVVGRAGGPAPLARGRHDGVRDLGVHLPCDLHRVLRPAGATSPDRAAPRRDHGAACRARGAVCDVG